MRASVLLAVVAAVLLAACGGTSDSITYTSPDASFTFKYPRDFIAGFKAPTREIKDRDPSVALSAVAAAVPDWSGGTRLGELIQAFLDRWGQRGVARGAVVIVASDGWERGEADLLGRQMERLHRLAHRVVWVNPHRGQPGYAPMTAGMVAALPHVDDFVDGHSLAALERLAVVISGGSHA